MGKGSGKGVGKRLEKDGSNDQHMVSSAKKVWLWEGVGSGGGVGKGGLKGGLR